MKSINWAALAFAAIIPGLSQAVPIKNAECAKNVQIQDVRGSSGRYFNEDCTVVYVLPPLVGQLSVSNYTPDASINDLCAKLAQIDKEGLNNQSVITANSTRLLDISNQVMEIEKNIKEGLVPVGQTRESMEARMDQLLEQGDKLRDRISKWEALNNATRLTFAQGEGGRGRFTIASTYQKLLSDYQRANPRVSVQPMPIEQSYLSVNEQLPDNIKTARMPAVLQLTVPAIGEMPLLLDPVILMDHKELRSQAAPAGGKLFNGAMSGEIDVSNIGACAIQRANGSARDFTAKGLNGYVVANAAYSYQLQVKRKVKLWYDYKKLVQIIHEQTTHGGLFSTKTLDSLTDNRSSNEWIGIEFSAEDSRVQFSEEAKKEIRREFLDRALANIVSLQTDSPTPLLGLISPGKNGASAAGDELQKCPNAYCQIGAAGLKVLSTIFGSTSATSSLLKTVSGRQEETMTDAQMIPAYGTYTFE